MTCTLSLVVIVGEIPAMATMTFRDACSVPGELAVGVNWTVRLQVPVGARSPKQVVPMTVKSPAFAPVTPNPS